MCIDSFYSPICLLMPPNVTAAAGLLLTTRYLGADLPARYRDWYRSMPPYSGDEEPVTEEWFSLLQTDQRYTTCELSLEYLLPYLTIRKGRRI